MENTTKQLALDRFQNGLILNVGTNNSYSSFRSNGKASWIKLSIE